MERRRWKEAGVIKIWGQPFFGCQNSTVVHYFLQFKKLRKIVLQIPEIQSENPKTQMETDVND